MPWVAVKRLGAFAALTLCFGGVARADDAATPEPPGDAGWCYDGDGIESLAPDMCHFSPQLPSGASPDTLVVFLHGVTKVGTNWQHSGQRAIVRAARAHGFSVIMPRGPLGAGSERFADHYNWPTSVRGQTELEAGVLEKWSDARGALEERNGQPFRQQFVFGFSAGAYYGASLLLRGRVPVQGYAVFAGGGAPAGVERWARGTQPKVPIYVGYGRKDRAWRDPERLGHALARMRWPARVVMRPRVGHSMTDAQVREAIEFLRKHSQR
ncbi:MAG: hypothetical protein KF718_07360 [Polyangiaceae bacterium]|nr:hypothetical protein [Polyangiaceae bacterium]